MGAWTAKAVEGFGLVQSSVASLLHGIGQDNEIVLLGVMLLIGLLALSVVWVLLLGVLRLLLAPFRGEREGEARPPSGVEGFGFARAERRPPAPGELDIVPSTAANVSFRGIASVGSSIKRPAQPRGAAMAEGEAHPAPAQPGLAPDAAPQKSAPALRLSEAAGAGRAPAKPKLAPEGYQQIKMRHLPHPMDRGSVVSARPEWTGKVMPASFRDAGAVEVCRVLSRRTAARAGSESVRAVDYRVCGLPRVDHDGRRKPDVLVYTVADRGLLPKGAIAKKPSRS